MEESLRPAWRNPEEICMRSGGHPDLFSADTGVMSGTAVYDLVIRTIVVERGNTAPGVLHTKKSSIGKGAGAGSTGGCADGGADCRRAGSLPQRAERPFPFGSQKCIDRGLPQSDRVGSTVWIFIPDRPDRPVALADCERAGADRAANMIK